jgi:hypothetical protein
MAESLGLPAAEQRKPGTDVPKFSAPQFGTPETVFAEHTALEEPSGKSDTNTGAPNLHAPV